MRNHLCKCLFAAVAGCLLLGCSPAAKKSRSLERAGKYFSAGEYEKAKVEYLNVLQIDPQSSIATEGLGLIWMEQGAPFRALPILLRARTQMSGNSEARTKLALALVQAGRIEEARKEALIAVQQASAPNEAFIVLAETIRTPADIEVTTDAIKKSAYGQSVWGMIASAKLLLLKEEVPAASGLLQRALNSNPKSTVVHSALAELNFRQGDPAKGREELKQAAELSPPRSVARMSFAEYQLQTGAVPATIAYLKDLVHQAPDYIPPKRLLAQIAILEKKYDDAQAFVKEIFTIDFANIDGHLVEAQILVARGDRKKAIEGLEALSKANRGFAHINLQLARTHLMDGHPERAVSVLEEGISAHSEHVESILLLAELNLRAGRTQAVVGDMSNLLRQRPSLIQAQTLLINGLRSLGRFDDAAAAVREQIRVMPRSPQPHVLLGTILLQQKNLNGAKMAFERAQELAPSHLPAVAALVDLDLRNKNYESAMRRIQEQKTKTPTVAEVHYLEATVFVAQSQWNNAETSLHKALELNPGLSIAYDLLLHTYTSSKNLPRAIRQLEDTLALQPNDQRARLLSAVIYSQMNEYGKARDAYEKILATKPDSTLALNNLAYLYAENLNQLDQAHDLANRARTLEPESPVIADTLGWILFKRKDYPRALELIRESAAKIPDNPEIQYHLGMASQMGGQNDAARAAFERAASASGEFPGKSSIKERLASLPGGNAKASGPNNNDKPAK